MPDAGTMSQSEIAIVAEISEFSSVYGNVVHYEKKIFGFGDTTERVVWYLQLVVLAWKDDVL